MGGPLVAAFCGLLVQVPIMVRHDPEFEGMLRANSVQMDSKTGIIIDYATPLEIGRRGEERCCKMALYFFLGNRTAA